MVQEKGWAEPSTNQKNLILELSKDMPWTKMALSFKGTEDFVFQNFPMKREDVYVCVCVWRVDGWMLPCC